MFHCPYNKGFTLPELIVSMAVILTIFAFGSINLLRVITTADLDQAVATFIADAKSQQSSSMLGDSQGEEFFSIRIDVDSYTLFKGAVYLEGEPGNYKVNYPQSVTASTDLANSVITFSAISGEVYNYDSDHNQVAFTGPGGKSVTIKFNKLGNVYYVNRN